MNISLSTEDIEEISALFRTNKAAQLRHIQAQALVELWDARGLFGAMRVGSGKTLVSFLAPKVLDAKRPVLLTTAGLIEKTRNDILEYSKNWFIPKFEILSYEILGRADHANDLQNLEPDLIIADEGHKLKNIKAAVTRRVEREIIRGAKFVVLSGTLLGDNFWEYAHLLIWSLGEYAPIPNNRAALDAWAFGLSKPKYSLFRPNFAELNRLGVPTPEEFRRILVNTPGIVISDADVDCPAEIQINKLPAVGSPEISDAIHHLRTQWALPDGYLLSDAAQVWSAMQQLALGFFYTWDPRPSPAYMQARSDWAKYVRNIIARGGSIDSEEQVKNLVLESDTHKTGKRYLERWLKERAAYTGVQHAIFLSEAIINQCAAWMRTPGVVWSEFDAFGRKLADRVGARYFGSNATDKDGTAIFSVSGKEAIVASRPACGTGQNLQMFDRALVLTPRPDPEVWEQLLGRHHRFGQKSSSIAVDVLIGCPESLEALTQAKAGARFIQRTSGLKQKLLVAHWR
jgi:hypothetical protein